MSTRSSDSPKEYNKQVSNLSGFSKKSSFSVSFNCYSLNGYKKGMKVTEEGGMTEVLDSSFSVLKDLPLTSLTNLPESATEKTFPEFKIEKKSTMLESNLSIPCSLIPDMMIDNFIPENLSPITKTESG